jgi:hypothetical protein
VGLQSPQIKQITSSLLGMKGNSAEAAHEMEKIGIAMQQSSIQAADMLSTMAGIEKGSPEYERLR